MNIYADTNFLTHFYLGGSGSRTADALLAKHRPVLPVTWLVRVETINAFEQAVYFGYGKTRVRVTPELAAICQAAFRDHLRDGIAMQLLDIPLNELMSHFEEIALRQTAKHGFRTYDILHVASALILGCDTFWSFDKKAAKLAKLEGLQAI